MQNRKLHQKIMWITTTAMMIAGLIVLQWATGLIPLPTKLAQQLLTGSCVNAVLAVSVLMGGVWCGVTVAALAPVFAQLLGVGAQFVQLVPAIMIGNAVYVLLLSVLATRKPMRRWSGICAVAVAATAKFAVLLLLVRFAINPLMGGKLPAMLLTMFSWPQLVTGLLGGLLVISILPVLKRALKRA